MYIDLAEIPPGSPRNIVVTRSGQNGVTLSWLPPTIDPQPPLREHFYVIYLYAVDTPPAASELNETEGLVIQQQSPAIMQTFYLLEYLRDSVHYIAQIISLFGGGPQSMRSEYVYVSFQQGELVVVHWDRTDGQESQITRTIPVTGVSTEPLPTDTSSTTESADTIPPVTSSGRDRMQHENSNTDVNQILIGEEISC